MSRPAPASTSAQEPSRSFSPFFGLLKGFLLKPKDVASIAPSSRFLIRHILAAGDVAQARTIVELGPGTGVVTRQLLQRMSPDGRLLAVEIHDEFVEILKQEFPDPRFEAIHGSSTDLVDLVGAGQADLVISGIPFSTMDPEICNATLRAVQQVLTPDGHFIAYQFRDHVRRFAEPIFGRHVSMKAELRNVPPMRVYAWRNVAP